MIVSNETLKNIEGGKGFGLAVIFGGIISFFAGIFSGQIKLK